MAFMSNNDGRFQAQLEDAVTRVVNRTGYTHVLNARLGNGDNLNPVVRVPNTPGMVYVYVEADNTRQVLKARDINGLVPFDNRAANMDVKIGYQPGDSPETGADYVLFAIDAATSGFYGGVAPNQLELNRLAYLQPDRVRFMTLIPQSGLTVKLVGGFGRYGNTTVIVPTQSYGSLSAHLPPSPATERYVACYWNVVTAAAAVTEGTVVAINSGINPLSILPLAIPPACVRLAFVRLRYGQTTIQEADIFRAPDMFYIPGGEGGGDTGDILTNASGSPLTNASGVNLTDAGT